jgi:hypothetical protein
MKKKLMLLSSFALATVLVVGQMSFAAGSDDNGMGNMMNGNGTSGMMQMMENENMGKMTNAMNSPEGQEMMNSCGSFMDSNGDDEAKAEEQSNL